MNPKEDLGIVFIILLFAALFCFIGYTTGYSRAQEHTRQEAVDNKAAAWHCDQKDGIRHIKWRGCPHLAEKEYE